MLSRLATELKITPLDFHGSAVVRLAIEGSTPLPDLVPDQNWVKPQLPRPTAAPSGLELSRLSTHLSAPQPWCGASAGAQPQAAAAAAARAGGPAPQAPRDAAEAQRQAPSGRAEDADVCGGLHGFAVDGRNQWSGDWWANMYDMVVLCV